MTKKNIYKLGILSTHPIQYYSPLYKKLSKQDNIDLTVYYCNKQSSQQQARSGFGIEFEWDTELLEGYNHKFLNNISKNPDYNNFFGCDTPELFNIISNEKFDAFLVHGWYVKSFWQAINACKKTITPVLVRGDSQLNTPHSFIKKLFKNISHRFILSKFDGCLYVGKRSKEYFKYYGINDDKLYFSPHCIDNYFFQDSIGNFEIQKIKTEWEVPNNSIVFLFVGKLTSKKRPLDYVKAIELAQKKNTNITGIIVGDGILKKEVLKYVKEQNVRIKFLGFLNQKEIRKAYVISDCLVLPSDGGETWGLVVNEAMASGLPAIVSDQVGCSPDLVKKNITGEIFPVGDHKCLSNIIYNFSLDKIYLKKLGQSARKHIQNYSLDKSVEGIIRSVIAVKSYYTC